MGQDDTHSPSSSCARRYRRYEMIFVSVDDDAHWEVVVQGRFMTGIGPEGSHPFPAKEGFCAKTNDEYFLKCANVRYPLPPDIGRVC